MSSLRSFRLPGIVLVILTIAATFALAPAPAGAATAPKPLRITTTSLAPGIAGGAYSATLHATGGTAPYHWLVEKGRLPKGLTLSDSGVISGTPQASGNATFTAEVDDSATPIATAVLRSLALDIGPQRLYVANNGGNTVSEYALAPKGNLPPVTTMTNLPYAPGAIAVGPSGDVYVVYAQVDAIAVYAPGTTDQQPIAVLFGAQTQLSAPFDLAFDARGDLYVSNLGNNTVTEYAPGAQADAAPIAVIGGDKTALTAVGAITVDAYGRVVVGAGEGYLDVFAPGSDGNIAPSYEIGGGATGIQFAVGLAATGADLYVLSRSQTGTAVIDLAEDARGNAVPRTTIAGADTRLLNGGGIALDGAANLYVTNQDGLTNRSWVTTFAPGASGDAKPVALLQGKQTGLVGPIGIAVGAPLYATNTDLPPASVGTAYSHTFGAALGNGPYRWSILLGALPPGLRLTSAGVLRGTPTQPGVTTVDVEVRDAAQESAVATITIAVDVPPLVYVASSTFGHSAVVAFTPGETGDSPPVLELFGPDTGLDQPQGIAFDASADLWVANYSGTITEYAPDASGDEMPIRTIGGSHTGLLSPSALAFDRVGNLFVANGLGNDVLEFAPDATGDATPTATITGLSNPVALAFDPQGRLWVSSGDTVEAIQTVNGPAHAIATLSGAETALDGVKGIAFDADGWLHVSNLNSDAETVYAPGSIGDTPPLQSVSVALPWGVAADTFGRVTVASNAAPYAVDSFGRFGSSPTSISGSSTGLSQPTGVALTPVPFAQIP
jgi:hypothetical protein